MGGGSFYSCFVLVFPLWQCPPRTIAARLKDREVSSPREQRETALKDGRLRRLMRPGIDEMNAALEITAMLAGLIGFGRIFLADEGASHRLSGALILAGLVGKVALSM